VDSRQIIPKRGTILRCSTVECERNISSFAEFKEISPLVCCSKSLQEPTERRSQSVICFICGSPEGIPTGRWFRVDFENGVVGRDFFKSDISVPSIRRKSRTLVFIRVIAGTELADRMGLQLSGVDDADFLITEFGGVQCRMSV
jgi:hypothetical protein